MNARILFHALYGLLLAAPTGGVLAQVPAHLDLQSAVIREEPPFDPATIAARVVVVELVLAGPPTCDATTPFLAYGILMDRDANPATGEGHPGYAPLGVEARVSADCDATSGTFFSNAGTASLTNNPDGTTTVAITLTVADLPRVEFDWIAFAQEGDDLIRLPAAPDSATWAIMERSIP